MPTVIMREIGKGKKRLRVTCAIFILLLAPQLFMAEAAMGVGVKEETPAPAKPLRSGDKTRSDLKQEAKRRYPKLMKKEYSWEPIDVGVVAGRSRYLHSFTPMPEFPWVRTIDVENPVSIEPGSPELKSNMDPESFEGYTKEMGSLLKIISKNEHLKYAIFDTNVDRLGPVPMRYISSSFAGNGQLLNKVAEHNERVPLKATVLLGKSASKETGYRFFDQNLADMQNASGSGAFIEANTDTAKMIRDTEGNKSKNHFEDAVLDLFKKLVAVARGVSGVNVYEGLDGKLLKDIYEIGEHRDTPNGFYRQGQETLTTKVDAKLEKMFEPVHGALPKSEQSKQPTTYPHRLMEKIVQDRISRGESAEEWKQVLELRRGGMAPRDGSAGRLKIWLDTPARGVVTEGYFTKGLSLPSPPAPHYPKKGVEREYYLFSLKDKFAHMADKLKKFSYRELEKKSPDEMKKIYWEFKDEMERVQVDTLKPQLWMKCAEPGSLAPSETSARCSPDGSPIAGTFR